METTNHTSAPVWFITGASRGFGSEFARVALEHGCKVAATARKPEAVTQTLGEHENLLPIALDVTNQEQIDDAVKKAIDAYGRIDVLVNNAGYGIFGALEEITDAETRAIFDTNVFGAMNVTRAVLPHMRSRKSGRIVMLGSAASLACDPGGALYDTTKAALASLSNVLSLEMKPFGIQSMVIAPGMFRTNFFDGSSIQRPTSPMSVYNNTPARGAEDYCLSNNYQQHGDPAKAAELVYQVVSSPEPMPAWLPLGKDAVKKYEKTLTRMIEALQPYKEAASDLFVEE